MHNNQWEELIPFYVAQTLSRREAAAFEQHLATCETCQQSLTEWGAVASAVRAEAATHLRDLPPLSPALMAQMRGEFAPLPRSAQQWVGEVNPQEDLPPLRMPPQTKPPRRVMVRPLPSFALAAAVILVVVGAVVALMTVRNRMNIDQFASGDGTETPIASPTPDVEQIIFPTVGDVVTPEVSPTPEPLIIFATSTPRPVQTMPVSVDETDVTEATVVTPAPQATLQTIGTPEAVVRSETINLRSGPGTAYEIVATASPGARLPIVAQTGSGANLWYVVERPQGGTAWVYGSVVVVEPEGVDIPVAGTIPPPPTLGATATPTNPPNTPANTPTAGVSIRSGNWMHLATMTENTCVVDATPMPSYTEAVIIVPALDGSYLAMTYAANGLSVTLFKSNTPGSYAGTYTRTDSTGASVTVTVTITFSTPTTYNGDEIARQAGGCYIRTSWYGSAN